MSVSHEQISRSRLLVYGLVVVVATLVLLELGARLVEPEVYRALREFRLADALAEYKLWQQALFLSFGGAHQPDPDLLWHFRPRMRQPLFTTNSRALLTAEEFEYDKPPNTIRILLLGDSSPVGLGLKSRDEAFGETAARLHQQKWRGLKNIEFINAAVSGYSSEQARRFLAIEGIRYQPDYVVCYLGNNDGSINGYLSDREIFAAQDWSFRMRTVFDRSALYRLMRSLLSPVLADVRSAESGLPKVRLSPTEFRENMCAIISLSREVGATTICINPPIPLRWPAGLQFKLFAHMADSAGQWVVADPIQRNLDRPAAYCLDSTMLNRTYGDLDPYVREVISSAYADSGALDSIETFYLGKLISAPDDPVLLNNLGVAYWRQGKLRQAVDFFQRSIACDSVFVVPRYNLGITIYGLGEAEHAIDILQETADRDSYSLRIKTPYRQALFTAVAQCGGVLLDGAALFAAQDNERLFIDHCHPTPAGHRLLAERLAAVIDSLGKINLP